MRKYAPIIISSLLSAFTAVVLYKQFENPREVIIRETIPARYTHQDGEDFLSGDRFRSVVSAAPTNFTKAAESVTAAVVNVKTFQEESGFPLWRSGTYSSSSGSGVIVSPDGYIVTNNHVISDGGTIEITLNDKRELKAEIIGIDLATDLALLRIKADNLAYLPFGNSDSLRVGEWVLAIGNPFDLESTVTAGIVSAKGRSIDILEGNDRIESFIQTDAAVNPGNSGGALVDAQGRWLGINTAISTRTGFFQGYSFAIPVNIVNKIVDDIIEYGAYQRAYLGVGIFELDGDYATENDLPLSQGVVVDNIDDGGSAQYAGILPKDVILAVDGRQVRSVPQLQEIVGRAKVGDTLTLTVFRNGREIEVPVRLKAG